MAGNSVSQEIGNFKVCTGCKIKKDLSEFYLEPKSKDGRRVRCKSCIRLACAAYRLANPEKIQAAQRKYSAQFPERIQEARNFTYRRIALERRERRVAEGRPLLEARTTDAGRRCSSCRRRKPSAAFPIDAGCSDGVSVYCRECRNRIARKQAQKPAVQEYRRQYMRKLALKKYGLTTDDFENLCASQGGKCAICEEPLKFGTGGCGVDHNHVTGEVRGLLCRLCNVGVGHFRESEKWLLRAIDYLRRSSA